MIENSIDLPCIDKQPRVRRSTYIADHLREMIFTGTLKPGDRLPTEEQLCRHFGVSRTTLRESVQMLRVSGLLDVTPGRGSFIKLPDPSLLMKDLALIGHYDQNSYEYANSTCLLLQTEMVSRACDASVVAKKVLHNKVINRQNTAEEIEKSEKEWHLAIAGLSNNSIATTIVSAMISMCLSKRLKRFENPDEVMRTMGVQIRVNSAIMDGDKETAMRIMSSYLGESVSITHMAA